MTKKNLLVSILVVLCACLMSITFTSCKKKLVQSESESQESESEMQSEISFEESKITFKTFSVDGTTVTAKNSFPNATTEFSFADEIEIYGDVNYQVSKDKYGSQTYLTKTVPLEEGDNVYYVFVIDKDQLTMFTVTIRRRPMYTVSFNTSGGASAQSQTVEEDSLAIEPETTRAGYTLTGWDYDFTTPITQNTKITAIWSANKDTKYTVNYYWQNIDDNNYTLYEVDELTGTTDTTATAEIKEYEHFTYSAGKSEINGNIDPNGSLILNVYYTRNKYTLSINDSSAGSITNAGSYKYAGSLSSTATVNIGYNFLGWYSGENLLSKDLTYTFTVEKDVTAKFEVKAEMSNFNFTSSTTTCTITGIKDKTVTKIIIPNYVTSIGSSAFAGCYSLENITIPFVGDKKDGAENTYFGYIFGASSYYDNDFYVPSSLKTVVITGGTSIGSSAFYNCSSLTSVIIPNSVTSISGGAFSGCSSLQSITIPFVGANAGVTSNDKYQYPFGYIFGTNSYTGGTEIWQFYYGSSTSINTYSTYYIPTSLKSVTVTGGNILYGAFYNCDNLTSVAIGDSVTSIGDWAFAFCDSLTSVVIGDSVTSIGSYAFYNCSSLTSIEIPDSVTSIGDSAFSGCSSLQSMTIPFVGAKAGVTSNDTYQYPFGYIFGTSSYTGGTKTEQYYYGSSTSSITSSTYYIPISLKSVTVTGGNILYGAFYFCDSLTSVVIGDSVTTIGDEAFRGCFSLTSVVIGDSVTSIGSYAFSSCDNLTSVVIGESVTSIGEVAFYYCDNLTSITIPDSVTSIGSHAFYGCDNLTSITFEDTSTWYRTTSFTDWENKTGGTSTDVTDSSTNATNFKSYYYNYYWYKL